MSRESRVGIKGLQFVVKPTPRIVSGKYLTMPFADFSPNNIIGSMFLSYSQYPTEMVLFSIEGHFIYLNAFLFHFFQWYKSSLPVSKKKATFCL